MRRAPLLAVVALSAAVILPSAGAAPKANERILVVLVSRSNIVQDKVIRLDENFSQDELDQTARYLNTEFRGKSLLARQSRAAPAR